MVEEQWELAARLFGSVNALPRSGNFVLPKFDQEARLRDVATVQPHLDKPTFDVAWQSGESSNVTVAIEEALQHAS